MKYLGIAALALAVGACAMPETAVRTGSSRPQISVRGAPADAILAVDGLVMGPASVFDGNPKVLIVEEGVHQVEIRQREKAIHVEKTFVSNGETRVIVVNKGNQ